MKSVPVAELLSDDAEHLNLKLIYGRKAVQERTISSHRIQKPGLALAGFFEHIHEGRVQILGNTEITFLFHLESIQRQEVLDKLCQKNVACLIITKNLEIPVELRRAVRKYNIPLLRTDLLSSQFISDISLYLEDRLAPETNFHGVMLDVYGIGVLITGRSGIGKTECAVELIKRGHRLVADDVVFIKRKQGFLIGTSSDLLRYHVELRGVGILSIRDMFGVTAIRMNKRLELVVQFVDWKADEAYDRLGLEGKDLEILGMKLPLLTCPVSPGRNMAVIVEVAARNHLLKIMGFDAAQTFAENLADRIASGDKAGMKCPVRINVVE